MREPGDTPRETNGDGPHEAAPAAGDEAREPLAAPADESANAVTEAAHAGDAAAAVAPDVPGEPAALPLPAPEPAPPVAAAPARPRAMLEPPETVIELPATRLAAQTRRDFLLFAAGLAAAAGGIWAVLPELTKRRLLPAPVHDALDTVAARTGLTRDVRERALDRALTFDDDIAEALYSPRRRVRTYARSQVTPLRNNYAGRTPGPEILAGWSLELSGLASGTTVRLTRDQLLARFALVGQVTRFVCVEGWSAVAWWGGIRASDLLAAFPPAPGARWAALRSEVNLDGHGRPDPYYVSVDLDTLRHPQTLFATHHGGRPLPLAHGAPLRLLVPVKLGLKNIKAITHIAYTESEPPDYWNRRGYSRYDGL